MLHLTCMARSYVFAPGEYYHLYARGVEKLPVYRTESDYRAFVERLYLLNTVKSVNIRDLKRTLSSSARGLTSGRETVFAHDRGETLVEIGAYCLMGNHFHILVQEKDADGKGISKFMQKLMTSYTMYFNHTHERTGSLFSSSFKARHVVDDNHLKYLFAYIHLNPRTIVKNKKLESYQYSSYPDFLGKKRPEMEILNPQAFPKYFSSPAEVRSEIRSWLDAGE